MRYTGKTKLMDILAEHPWLEQELPKRNPIFEKLKNPAAQFIVRRMTVQDAARFSGESVDFLLEELDKVIDEHEGPSN